MKGVVSTDGTVPVSRSDCCPEGNLVMQFGDFEAVDSESSLVGGNPAEREDQMKEKNPVENVRRGRYRNSEVQVNTNSRRFSARCASSVGGGHR